MTTNHIVFASEGRSQKPVMKFVTQTLIVIGMLTLATMCLAQTPPAQKPKPVEANNSRLPEDQDVETLKIDTNLVTVPVIASSRMGTYIADLKKEEFKITEDGVAQEIAFLASVNAPFYVVLMLDTSDSTQDKLPQIQRAAISFLDQLGPNDKVKVISFDGEIHDLNDFTGDKAILRNAITSTRASHSTRVYDAVQVALDSLRLIQQRKAIVIFTDGMDYHSESSTFESTLHDLDESGVIVYPIRFDTRAYTEQLARKQEQEMNGANLPTSSILRQPTSGTTPTTFPGDDPSPVPAHQRSPLPLPDLRSILGGRTTSPRTSPNDPFPDTRPTPDSGNRDPNRPADPNKTFPQPRNDSISGLMDNLYLMADSYLKELADRTGGQLYRADTVSLLPQSFAAIAAELRTQYLLGYYPANKNNDGSYRKIQVKTTRKDISVRARPGYRARRGMR
jgi:VWFA-related protein